MSWRIETNSMGRVVVIVNDQGWPIARMVDDTDKDSARLIAAAPDLLKVLTEIVDDFGPTPSDKVRWLGKARALIAEATAPKVQHLPSDDTEGGAL